MQALKGNKPQTYADALLLEKNGDVKDALVVYRALHRQSPKNTRILNRMIIVCRKLKDVVNEIKYINTAIRIQEQYYHSRKTADKKTIAISKQLNLLLGHTNKKGDPVLKPAEIIKLEMRRDRLTGK